MIPVTLAATVIAVAIAGPGLQTPPGCADTDDPCKDGASTCAVERSYWHFGCKRYSVAADGFADLYTADPRPEFLYNAANARRLSGDCWTALALYKAFLDLGPPSDQVDVAQENITRCQGQIALARKQADDVRPPPPVVREVHDDPPAPAPPPRPRWPRDPAGAALVGVGAAIAATGIGLVAGGAWHRGRAGAAMDDVHYGDRMRTSLALTRAGIPVLGAGASLLVAGIVRWAVLARREKRGRSVSAARSR